MAEGDLGGGYEALTRGERGPLLELLAAGFEWVEPDGTLRHGADQALDALGEGELTVDRMERAGGRTYVTGTMRAAGHELPFAHVWEARDGAFVRAASYFDGDRLALAATRRQLADAADDLLEQAAEIRRQWNRLGDALRAAGLESEAHDAGEGEPAPAASRGSARLVAVDMAHEGSSREEIEQFLLEELGVEDVEPILDEVFHGGEPAAPADPAEAADAAEAHRLARLFARNRD